MATLAEVRAKLAASAAKGNNQGQKTSSGGDNASYPFWSIPVGSEATLRFLPDADPDNTFFWRKREVIRLPFEGVVGGDYPTNNKVEVTVPCVDMFDGMSCPIIAATRPWWKDDAGKEKNDLARIYWKKKSFLYQGFVVNSPFQEENTPENPIRRFVINPSIHEIIETSLVDPEMEDMPTDYVGGIDFRVAKTQKGEWANYSTSKWARKPRSLNDAEMTAIETHKLWDLKQFLGRKPDADELAAIKAMFEASIAGDPYDMASFGQYFRPWGARGDTGSSAAPAPAARNVSRTTAPEAPITESVRETVAPAVETTGAKSDPQEILARIRAKAAGK